MEGFGTKVVHADVYLLVWVDYQDSVLADDLRTFDAESEKGSD